MNGVWIVIKGRCLETFAIKAFNDGCKWNPLKSGSLGGKNIPLRAVPSITIPREHKLQIFRRIGTHVCNTWPWDHCGPNDREKVPSIFIAEWWPNERMNRTNERKATDFEGASVSHSLIHSVGAPLAMMERWCTVILSQDYVKEWNLHQKPSAYECLVMF